MTPFASVALYERNGDIVFKPPRKELPSDKTQARKSAMRFWQNRAGDDTLVTVILAREFAGRLEISERAAGTRRPWLEFSRDIEAARREPHLAACMAELGITPAQAATPMPDVLEINGVIYRREI